MSGWRAQCLRNGQIERFWQQKLAVTVRLEPT